MENARVKKSDKKSRAQSNFTLGLPFDKRTKNVHLNTLLPHRQFSLHAGNTLHHFLQFLNALSLSPITIC